MGRQVRYQVLMVPSLHHPGKVGLYEWVTRDRKSRAQRKRNLDEPHLARSLRPPPVAGQQVWIPEMSAIE